VATNNEKVCGMTFLQSGTPVASIDGVLHTAIKCFHCQGHGHYATTCPQDTSRVQLLQVAEPVEQYQSEFTFLHLQEATDFIFHQNDRRYDIIPVSWVLLDS
jgi:hypothetical protein